MQDPEIIPSLQLQDPRKQSVAYLQPAKHGIFTKSRDGALEVRDREAHEMLDTVVVSFLIMWEEQIRARRSRQNALNAANAANSAALSAGAGGGGGGGGGGF